MLAAAGRPGGWSMEQGRQDWERAPPQAGPQAGVAWRPAQMAGCSPSRSHLPGTRLTSVPCCSAVTGQIEYS